MRRLVFLCAAALCAAAAGPWKCAYEVTSSQGRSGARTSLTLEKLSGFSCGLYGDDVSPLSLTAEAVSDDILRVTIKDPRTRRWEVPKDVVPGPANRRAVNSPRFKFEYTANPFTFAVVRAATGEAVFNTSTPGITDPLVFEDQYLGVSTVLPAGSHYVYGLGEREGPLRVEPGRDVSVWNADPWSPAGVSAEEGINLYGDHPMYVELRSGAAHGVFWANSNAKRFSASKQGDTLEMRAVGGIVDLWFFLGPTPEKVVQQYTEVVGRPVMPPVWALGYHQSGLGQSNRATLDDIVANIDKHELPCDVIWSDIDSMDRNRDFTFDPATFPQSYAADLVGTRLAQRSIHWVPILDHCIVQDPAHEPYTLGLELGVFVKDPQTSPAKPLLSRLWAGDCHLVDFSHPNATKYWTTLARKYHAIAPFSGLWIDMNEPSNVCDGYCGSRVPTGKYNNPPWNPLRRTGWRLYNHSLPLDVNTVAGLQYNTHDLYGFYQSCVTRDTIAAIVKSEDEPFVLTRSTSFGTARKAAHWLGDNDATWEDLRWSVPGVLQFQLFGMPFVGTDIGGFLGKVDTELFTRWFQIGAFYPFSRNHASDVAKAPHFPWTFPSVLPVFKKVYGMRYRLLPYLYTLMHESSQVGTPVWRPLWMDDPTDKEALVIEKQAMLGRALLLSPVLDKGATSVRAYFSPSSLWYDLWTYNQVSYNGWVTVPAPLDKIPVHIRGGSVIPMQGAGKTTAEVLQTPYSLLVAPDDDGEATGVLHVPNVKLEVSFSLDILGGLVAKPKATAEDGKLNGTVQPLKTIEVLGIPRRPHLVVVDGKSYSGYAWNSATKVLSITSLSLDFAQGFVVEWMY